MDSTRDAVLKFEVHFRYGVFGKDRGVRNVTCASLEIISIVCCHESLQSLLNLRIAADSTMLRMVNLFIALSLGVHLEQFEQRIGLT